MQRGELPDTLDALVPEYLDAVPLDVYDGQKIRYSRARRRLWSPGSDLAVNDGATAEVEDGYAPAWGWASAGDDLVLELPF